MSWKLSYCFYYLTLTACTLGAGLGKAYADEGVQLKNSLLLQEGPGHKQDAPYFLRGNQFGSSKKGFSVMKGAAEVRHDNVVIKANELIYDDDSKVAKAIGDVLVNQLGNIYTGSFLDINLDTYIGYFENPKYRFTSIGTHGKASRVNFLSKTKSVVVNATYTSCKCTDPAWRLTASEIQFDMAKDEGVARNAVLRFQNVPILASPWLSFPLSSKRRSGLLPPSMGSDNVNGLTYAQPYYWDIAPNQDATFTPVWLSARGFNLKNQYRYLTQKSSGTLNFNYMPSDDLRKKDRWAASGTEMGSISTPIGQVSNVINLNRVSDDDYWKDFSDMGNLQDQPQRLLSNDATFSWQKGPFSTWFLMQRWQTLQDLSNPITPPFDRMPQIGVSYGRSLVGGINWSVTSDVTHFVANSPLVTTPNAKRATMNNQWSYSWARPWGFFTPQIQLHTVGYNYDQLKQGWQSENSFNVPTYSLNSGLYFDRHFSLNNQSYTQTFEPRAVYVYAPYVNQSMVPNYDTSYQDFNYSSIFNSNTFVGNDKVADANMLTVGAISRFWQDSSGRELARFAFAQRLRFSQRRVLLNASDQPVPAGFGDILAGADLYVTPAWSVESTVQYDAKTNLSQQAVIRTSFHPEESHVFNADYLFRRANSEQLSLSWQWPLHDLWFDSVLAKADRLYGVGSVQFSVQDSRWVNSLFGIEYNAGCWIGRVLVQNQQTGVSSYNRSLMFQIEFVGFTRLGIGSRAILSDNIPRYDPLHGDIGGASRYSYYN